MAIPDTATLLTMFPASPPLPNGYSEVTGGRDVAGDRGGAIFVYDAADTTTLDNAGTVRIDAVGRRWKAQLVGDACNVELFGVIGGDPSFNATSAARNKPLIDNMLIHGPKYLLWQNPIGLYCTTGHVLDGTQSHEHVGVGQDLSRGICGSGIPYAHAAEVASDPYAALPMVFQNGEYGPRPTPTWFRNITVQAADYTTTIGFGIMKSTTQHMQYDYNFEDVFVKGYSPIHFQWANLNSVTRCTLYGYDSADSQFLPSETVLDGQSIQKITFLATQFAQFRSGAGQVHLARDSGLYAIFGQSYIGTTDETGYNGWDYQGQRVIISHHTERVTNQLVVTTTTHPSWNANWIDPVWGGPNSLSQLISQREPRSWVASNGTVYAPAAGYIEALCGITFESNGDALSRYVAQTPWTPVDGSGAGLTFSGVEATYEVIGGRVFVDIVLNYPSNSDGRLATIGNLPISFPSRNGARVPINALANGTAVIGLVGLPTPSSSEMKIVNIIAAANVYNADLSGAEIRISGNYPLA